MEYRYRVCDWITHIIMICHWLIIVLLISMYLGYITQDYSVLLYSRQDKLRKDGEEQEWIQQSTAISSTEKEETETEE